MAKPRELAHWRAERLAKDAAQVLDRLNLQLAGITPDACPSPLKVELAKLAVAAEELEDYLDAIP